MAEAVVAAEVTAIEEGKLLDYILDDDLPKIGEAYREFRVANPEPGPAAGN